jgi:hypothetical protein
MLFSSEDLAHIFQESSIVDAVALSKYILY